MIKQALIYKIYPATFNEETGEVEMKDCWFNKIFGWSIGMVSYLYAWAFKIAGYENNEFIIYVKK